MVLYKITNQINGKVYVGVTSLTAEERLAAHKHHHRYSKQRLHAAMRKHGPDNFVTEELASGLTPEEADLQEKQWIAALNSTDYAIGYNMSEGGVGKSGSPSEATRQKMSASIRRHRQTLSADEKKSMTAAANAAKRGMIESDESRRLKSEAQKKRWQNMTPEQRRSHGQRTAANTTPETRARQVRGMNEAYSPARQKGNVWPKVTCPHCQKTGGLPAMKKYHFDRCKHKQHEHLRLGSGSTESRPVP